MLEREKIRLQNVIYKKHTRPELPPEQNRPKGSVPGKKTNHLTGQGMGPLPISGRVGEDPGRLNVVVMSEALSIPGRPSMEK